MWNSVCGLCFLSLAGSFGSYDGRDAGTLLSVFAAQPAPFRGPAAAPGICLISAWALLALAVR